MSTTESTHSFNDVLAALQSAQRVLISSHVGPDGDSIGSQLALYRYLQSLGRRAVIYNEGHLPHNFAFLDKLAVIETEAEKWVPLEGGFDLALILECTALERIGEVRHLVGDGMTVVNIDHHCENRYFGRINLVDTQASSVGEIIHRMFRQAGIKLTREIAEYLYLAVLTDTGRFHFTSTTPEAFRTAAELLEAGVNVKRLTDETYYNWSEAQLRLTGELLSRMELEDGGRVCFLTLYDDDLKRFGLKYGDMEGLVEWTMRVRGVLVGALFKQVRADFTKISLRSQGLVDVCRLAQKFNGGGHVNASGCQLEADIVAAKAQLLKAIRELLANA